MKKDIYGIPFTDLTKIDVKKPGVYRGWVSPELARIWLEMNVRNRLKSQGRIDYYQAIMDEGNWDSEFTEGITFSKEGELENGQHSLEAIIAHGKPVVILVWCGAPARIRQYFDNNRVRKLGDRRIFVEDQKENAIVGSIISNWKYIHGSSGRLTPNEEEDIWGQYEAGLRWIARFSIRPPGNRAACRASFVEMFKRCPKKARETLLDFIDGGEKTRLLQDYFYAKYSPYRKNRSKHSTVYFYVDYFLRNLETGISLKTWPKEREIIPV
jgi:hypothetical protein